MTTIAYQPRQINPIKQRAARILKGNATFEERHIPNHEDLVQVISELRSSDCVIAFITGVWDLFHIGHAEYLQKGRDEAVKLYPDRYVILVVGYDSDAFTRLRKGEGRPIVPEDERARVLGHVRAVDIITPQREEDQLFKLIPHDVRIISESTKDLPALERIRSVCEHLVNLPPQAETSTTARVRRLAFDGFSRLSEEITKAIEKVKREYSSS